jgi:S-sulfo-L-cysteine synthase (3-phospho-L-serine-dependent)
MSRLLVFVESNSTGTGRLFVRRAFAQGLTPVLLAEDASRYPWISEERVDVVAAETRSADAVVAACASLRRDGDELLGVVSSSEYYILTAATAAKRLGLPGSEPAAIEAVRHKAVQRRLLAAAGVAVPDFEAAGEAAAARGAALRIGLPVVVKPAAGTGSVGVTLCATAWDVEEHAGCLLAVGTNERGLPVPSTVLVERYVDGPEFSAEIFGGELVGLTRKHIGPLPTFVETGHDFPANTDRRASTVLGRTALRAARALGLVEGPVHVELRLTHGGAVVIEVNARLAGGFIPEIVRLASGVDLVAETIAVAAGTLPQLDWTRSRYASVRFLVPCEPSVVVDDGASDAARRVPHVVDVAVYPSPGAEVAPQGDFRDRVGHVVACTDTPEASALAAATGLAELETALAPDGLLALEAVSA